VLDQGHCFGVMLVGESRRHIESESQDEKQTTAAGRADVMRGECHLAEFG